MSNFTTPVSPQVIIEHYVLEASAGYTYLLVNTMTGAMLVPFLIALFYFSTEIQRKSPIFRCVSLGVAMGIVQAIQADYILLTTMRHPFNPLSIYTIISSMVLTSLPTYIIDIALLFRVIAVFPPSTTPRWRLALIIAIPILLKIFRFIEWVVWSVDGVRWAATAIQDGYHQSDLQRQCAIGRWALNLIDNCYITAVFLWRLRSTFDSPVETGLSLSTESFGNYLRRRIRTLFWLALSNFVLPVPMFAAELVLIAAYPNLAVEYIVLNILVGFVSIICAVFATVWRGASKADHTSSGPSTTLSLPRFRSPEYSGFSQGANVGRNVRRRHQRDVAEVGEMELGDMTFSDRDCRSVDYTNGPATPMTNPKCLSSEVSLPSDNPVGVEVSLALPPS